MLCHGFIREQHEVFDEKIGRFALFQANRDWFALGIQFDFHFCSIKFNSALGHAPRANLF